MFGHPKWAVIRGHLFFVALAIRSCGCEPRPSLFFGLDTPAPGNGPHDVRDFGPFWKCLFHLFPNVHTKENVRTFAPFRSSGCFFLDPGFLFLGFWMMDRRHGGLIFIRFMNGAMIVVLDQLKILLMWRGECHVSSINYTQLGVR